MCDAFSPVWLSAMLAAGAAAMILAMLSPRHWAARLAVGALAGGLIAAAFVLVWPDCLGRLERVPPELDRLWLSKVREAMPVYGHGFDTAIQIVTLPVAGLIGYALMLWADHRDSKKVIAWASLAAPALLAAALLLWQTRAGPAAQMLSAPGATALAWAAILWLMSLRYMLVRVGGVVFAFLVVSGLASGYLSTLWPDEPPSEYRQSVNVANWRCSTMQDLRAVALQPRGNVLTFVDLGPRLITVTPQNAVIGPYHRNSRQILDVMRAWRGNVANARAHQGATDRLCADLPELSEATIYRSEAPHGFYAQLATTGAELAAAVRAASNSPSDVARGAPAAAPGGTPPLAEAALDAVDHELGGKRGEDDAEQPGEHRLHLVTEQAHQRPGGEQGEQRQDQHRGQGAQHDGGRGKAVGAGGEQHRRSDRAGPGDHRDRHREDGHVLDFAGGDLLGAVFAPLGALLEHHVDGDQEQHDAARDPERGQRDAKRAEQILAEQREEEQNARGDQHRADRHRAAMRGRRLAGEAGEDRRAAGRIDHHQEGDEGGNEKRAHSPSSSGGGRPARRCAATRVLRSRTAIVIGPTPPGTGVIAPATSLPLA